MSAPGWLQGAGVAPSAHNTQPWQFSVLPDGRTAVRWAAERMLPVADPTSRDLYLSLGAAIESACLRALADGAPLHFEPAPPDADADRLAGWLIPAADAAEPDPVDLKLAAALERRQTVRGPHLPSPVLPDVQADLIAEAARHGRVLQIVTGRPTVGELAKLAGQATALLFADAAVHAELWRWLRLDPADPAYQRDGLTADCLELAGLPLLLARQLMPPARMRWLSRTGLHHALAADIARIARQSAAICLLSVPRDPMQTSYLDRAQLVDTGRVLQRLWLMAAAAGLTTHPLSALLDRPETAGRTQTLFAGAVSPAPAHWGGGRGEGAPLPFGAHVPAAVFRLGYASPAARSPRLPLRELLT